VCARKSLHTALTAEKFYREQMEKQRQHEARDDLGAGEPAPAPAARSSEAPSSPGESIAEDTFYTAMEVDEPTATPYPVTMRAKKADRQADLKAAFRASYGREQLKSAFRASVTMSYADAYPSDVEEDSPPVQPRSAAGDDSSNTNAASSDEDSSSTTTSAYDSSDDSVEERDILDGRESRTSQHHGHGECAYIPQYMCMLIIRHSRFRHALYVLNSIKDPGRVLARAHLFAGHITQPAT
jgi:hypothetical protein